MAQKELSRIQIRRGPLVDLSGVVLNTGEFGFAYDERRLFVGNRQSDGAPLDENVEIITEYSDINYEYVTNLTGNRSIFDRLRDYVSVKDYGLVSTDTPSNQTLAIQKIYDLLYNPSNSYVSPNGESAIAVPADNYLISENDYNNVGASGIRMYPNSRLVGENPYTTKFTSSSLVSAILLTSSNNGTNRYDVNTGLTTLSDNIIVENITFESTTAISPLISLDNAYNVTFLNCRFLGTGTTTNAIEFNRNTYAGELGRIAFINCEFDGFTNIVSLSDPSSNTSGIIFDSCVIKNSSSGITVGSGISSANIKNCRFVNITNEAVKVDTLSSDIGTTVENCVFENCGTGIDFGVSSSVASFGNESRFNTFQTCTNGLIFSSSSAENVSLFDKFVSTTNNITLNGSTTNAIIGKDENYGLSTAAPLTVNFSVVGTATTFLTLPLTSFYYAEIKYSLIQNSIHRFGTFRVVSDGTVVSTDDSFIEAGGTTTLVLSAIINAGNIECQYNATTNSAVFKYEIRAWK